MTFEFAFPVSDDRCAKVTVTLAAEGEVSDAFKWLACNIDYAGGKVDYDSVKFNY